jgi:hypothetical protein
MFILNPDPYSLPTFRIGPFTTSHVAINHRLPASDALDTYLHKRFAGRTFRITTNGRAAMYAALSHYRLMPDDTVTILTTSGNTYISGCVTSTISRYCKWSRKMEKTTRLLFVNHEFGYPYEDMAALKATGLPIIEDCCTTFFTDSGDTGMGETGDFVCYSFPKFFPIQVGGLLVANRPGILPSEEVAAPGLLHHIRDVMSYHIGFSDAIVEGRLRNYEYLSNKLSAFGLHPRFPLNRGVVPSVYLFNTSGTGLDLPAMKEFLWKHGIHCSVFYGEEAFFIPCHHLLSTDDLDYFVAVIHAFCQQERQAL